MFRYYLLLAVYSLKRSRIITTLMILAIGLGIGASMTMITVLHVMSGDPLPDRSAQLYVPFIDPLPVSNDSKSAACGARRTSGRDGGGHAAGSAAASDASPIL